MFVNVSDTNGPTFTNLTNITIGQYDSLAYQINATDSSGVSCFTVNDTTNFNINCSGYLTNKTALTEYYYLINLTANDTNNNLNSRVISITRTSLARIVLGWIYPTSNTNVTQLQFFNVSVNVTCFDAYCGDINVTLDPVTTTQYNFTTCGATANVTPTQTNCTANYTGTSLAGLVGVTNGIQNWTVPYTGTYTIEAAGANGGCTSTQTGGNGSIMRGDFYLTQGTVLQVLVGQSGGCISYGGGGGGTFVASGNNYSTATPLIVAGGGGGDSSSGSRGINSVATINGTDGTGVTGNKGVNGMGGSPASGYTWTG